MASKTPNCGLKPRKLVHKFSPVIIELSQYVKTDLRTNKEECLIEVDNVTFLDEKQSEVCDDTYLEVNQNK